MRKSKSFANALRFMFPRVEYGTRRQQRETSASGSWKRKKPLKLLSVQRIVWLRWLQFSEVFSSVFQAAKMFIGQIKQQTSDWLGEQMKIGKQWKFRFSRGNWLRKYCQVPVHVRLPSKRVNEGRSDSKLFLFSFSRSVIGFCSMYVAFDFSV